ncbi:MAG: signal peptidase I [Gemmatimonadaceae bacterium]
MTTWTVAAVLAAALMWITRLGTRWPSVYYMTGSSMEPTVRATEYFLAWSATARLSRGDLVIFRYRDEDGVFHVLRRLAAFAGDTVSMRAGRAVVNGVPQQWAFRIIEPEAWRSVIARGENLYDWGPWIVPVDSVMLLADTRDIIGWPDSRFIGYVSHNDILARVTRTLAGRRLR